MLQKKRSGTIIVTYTWSKDIKISRKSGIIAMDLNS